LLESQSDRVGRLGFVVNGHMAIRPVNFRWAEGQVLVRLGPGEMLEHLRQGREVTFETDEVEQSGVTRRAWSVVVSGPIRILEDPVELADAAATGLTPLVPEVANVYAALSVASISGRSFDVNALVGYATGADWT
jgi:nitroimidazol reductase NimA-like FMN-containing flavoprotein (pyridoxamine 5'-phosphate oxidase superfamily)